MKPLHGDGPVRLDVPCFLIGVICDAGCSRTTTKELLGCITFRWILFCGLGLWWGRLYLCSGNKYSPKEWKIKLFVVTTQVKKLQVMLRQANDQLEKTTKDKQELEDYMKQSAEDSSNQVQAFHNQDGGNLKMLFKSRLTRTHLLLDMNGLPAVEAKKKKREFIGLVVLHLSLPVSR